jgi:hypothetical protein
VRLPFITRPLLFPLLDLRKQLALQTQVQFVPYRVTLSETASAGTQGLACVSRQFIVVETHWRPLFYLTRE